MTARRIALLRAKFAHAIRIGDHWSEVNLRRAIEALLATALLLLLAVPAAAHDPKPSETPWPSSSTASVAPSTSPPPSVPAPSATPTIPIFTASPPIQRSLPPNETFVPRTPTPTLPPTDAASPVEADVAPVWLVLIAVCALLVAVGLARGERR